MRGEKGQNLRKTVTVVSMDPSSSADQTHAPSLGAGWVTAIGHIISLLDTPGRQTPLYPPFLYTEVLRLTPSLFISRRLSIQRPVLCSVNPRPRPAQLSLSFLQMDLAACLSFASAVEGTPLGVSV